jgi:hypothetical protein
VITAREKGRQLEVTVGGGDDKLVFLIPPVPAAVGAELLAEWADIKFGAVPPEKAAEIGQTFAEKVVSPAVLEQLEQLRSAEVTAVINAGFLWNVHGGGIDLVNEQLSDGLPKAHESLMKATGLWDVHSLLETSLDSASASQTSTDGSPATSTPAGGVTS